MLTWTTASATYLRHPKGLPFDWGKAVIVVLDAAAIERDDLILGFYAWLGPLPAGGPTP